MKPIPYLLLALMAVSLSVSIYAEAPPADPNLLEGVVSPFVVDGRLDIQAAIRHYEDLYRSKSSISEIEITITRPRRVRKLTMKCWTKGEEKVLLLIQSPVREKGTATLKVDRNLWNYLPRIKRTIRIPPSMMQAGWMGSDFTNDDLVREASLSRDYIYQLVGRSEVPAGWLVRFDAKPGIVGLWERLELVLSDDGTLPVAARYYDRKGRLARVCTWSEVKVCDGKPIPTRMILEPKDKKGYKTEMVYREIDFDIKVPESMFSLSRLEQMR